MDLTEIKKSVNGLSNTPLHPQWLLARHINSNYKFIAKEISNNVLDIGCGHKAIKTYIDNNINYYGLDYYQTAKHWYGCVPDMYGDAQSLPIATESISNVLLLDVLEHLPVPEQCIKEISRILTPGGKLILQVPFLYPLHDIPLDFHRWTRYGLENLFKDTGLTIIAVDTIGNPIETAGVILNIALYKTVINAINNRGLIMFLLLIIPFLVPIVNIVCFLFSGLSPDDRFMPLNYRIIAVKNIGR